MWLNLFFLEANKQETDKPLFECKQSVKEGKQIEVKDII